MESSAAARYLRPRPFVIAMAAATATLGDLGPPAFPVLYALVADEVGLPHAVPLPKLPESTSPPSMRSFSDILCIVHSIPFAPNANMAHQHGLRLPEARVRTVDNALRVMLDNILRSPDGLAHAAALMEPHIDPAMHGVYEPDGVISCFLRKVCVAFASLTFEAWSRLLHDLRLFVHPNPAATLSSYTPRSVIPNPAVSRRAAVELGKGLPMESADEFRACTNLYNDARQPVVASNLGLRSFSRLGQDRRADMAVPAVEYVVHLESQRRRDFATSVDALHRYFDLSLSEIGHVSSKAKPTSADDADESDGKDSARTEMQGHQYASLSLGILHANFGNSRGASIALDDAIRAAQHCADEACQARALNWIARTSSSIAKRHQLLHHANNNIALAQEELSTVFTPVSDLVPESVSLHSAQHGGRKNNEKEREELGSISSSRLSRIQRRIDYRRIDERIDSLLISAAAWESHAASPTALTVARMALFVAEKHDVRLGIHKARAIAAVASLMAVEGSSGKAEKLLLEHIESFSKPMAEGVEDVSTSNPEVEVLSRCLVWVQFESSLRQGDMYRTREKCEALAEIAEGAKHNSVSFESNDLTLDVLEAQCRLHIANQASKQAATEAESLCRRAAVFGRPARVVEGLRLRAEAHIISSSYNSALPAALAAVSLSHGLGLESAHVRSVLTLTKTILRMQEREPLASGTHALRVLKPILAKALGGMGALIRGHGYRLNTECLLAIAAGSNAEPEGTVVDQITRAIQAYQQCGDVFGLRDCYYILARVHHWRGEQDARNAAAHCYRNQLHLLSTRQPHLSIKT